MYDPVRFAAFQKKRQEEYQHVEKIYLLQGEAGWSALAAAILHRALVDWKRVQKRKPTPEQIVMAKAMGFRSSREELIEYFWSDELDHHTAFLNISPDSVRTKLEVPKKKSP